MQQETSNPKGTTSDNTDERIALLATHIEEILRIIGEDPSREGLLKTPERAAKALLYLTHGYGSDGTDELNQALFADEGSQMVIVRDIEFYSMCEHHILPFFGNVTIGYIPSDKIVGLSKLARLVEVYARRLQVQERFTTQVCQAIAEKLGAKGVIVVCHGQHMCMKMRGVEKQDSSTTTVRYCGAFADDPQLRSEFFAAIS